MILPDRPVGSSAVTLTARSLSPLQVSLCLKFKFVLRSKRSRVGRSKKSRVTPGVLNRRHPAHRSPTGKGSLLLKVQPCWGTEHPRLSCGVTQLSSQAQVRKPGMSPTCPRSLVKASQEGTVMWQRPFLEEEPQERARGRAESLILR